MKYPVDHTHKYCSDLSSPNTELLNTIEKNTFLHTIDPFNYSGHLQGRILSMFSKMIQPNRILEVGTFTGFATICLAEGLSPNGKLISIEINPEMSFLNEQHIASSPKAEQIKLIVGDAFEVMPTLKPGFDLIFMDGAKRQYEDYYENGMSLLNKGAYLIIDNVLWKGKIIEGKTDPRTKAMQAFNELILQDDRVENVVLPLCDGMQIVRKK